MVILAGFILYGYRKGMVRVIFSLVSMIGTLVLVSLLTPGITKIIRENTPIYEMVREKCMEQVQLKSEEEIQNKVDEQDKIKIAGIELPEEMQDFFANKAAQAANTIIEEIGIYEKISNYLADTIIKGIGAILTFIIVIIILHLLINMLDLIARLPVMKGMNHLGGAIAGGAEGVLVIWIIFLVIECFQSNESIQEALFTIQDNFFLKLLYDNNGIKYFILSIFR